MDKKSDKKNSLHSSAAPPKNSIRSLLRKAGLPGGTKTAGPYRYRPPKGHRPGNKLPQAPGGGYYDRFDNLWKEGSFHGHLKKGFTYEWDVQLSTSGKLHWGCATRHKDRLNVAPDGTLSH